MLPTDKGIEEDLHPARTKKFDNAVVPELLNQQWYLA
jgi:hypothetical protein